MGERAAAGSISAGRAVLAKLDHTRCRGAPASFTAARRPRQATALATVMALLGAALVVLGTPAGAVASPSKAAALGSCAPTKPALHPNRGRIGGIVPLARVLRGSAPCNQAAVTFNGTPPLLYGGGSVMGTSGAVTVTPIYWTGSLGIPTGYRSIINGYLTNVAADSGKATNVFATVTQYTAGANHIHYNVAAGSPLVDVNAFPMVGGCSHDTGAVYSDSSGYSTCVTDTQLQSEVGRYLTAHGLAHDLNHLYVVYLPKGVESCVDNFNVAGGGTCSLNMFCGYHSAFGSPASPSIYASMPYAVVDGASGSTCSSDGGTVGNQSPNGNLDADTEVSITSHEVLESFTDPWPSTGWADSTQNENGDDCAYLYGSGFGGTGGAEFNQTINGGHYFTQEEFSNQDYNISSANGCIQREDPPLASFTVTTPGPMAASAVNFDGSASKELDNSAPGAITSYSWDFGDGSPTGSGVSPSHAYSSAATYTVKLTVTDVDLFQATSGQQVVVSPLVSARATFTYPTTGQQNVDTTQSFAWTQAPGAQGYYLVVGTTMYGADLVSSGVLPAGQTSYGVPALPTGQTLYATVLTLVGGKWDYQAITFTAAPGLATLSYPVDGQMNVDTTKAFTWTPIPQAQGYILAVGTTRYGTDLVTSGILAASQTSYLVPALPAGVLYATLLTKVNGAFTRYQLVAFTAAGGQAHFTYPLAGATNVDTTQLFRWSNVPQAQAYYLIVGTTMYAADLVNSGVLAKTASSFDVGALPPAKTLYATLFTEIGGTWTRFQAITFTAAPGEALFSSPVNGQTNVVTPAAFTWVPIPAGQAYILVIGTSVYGTDLFNSGILPAGSSSVAVPGLPAARTLYATLLTEVNGAFTRSQLIAFTAR